MNVLIIESEVYLAKSIATKISSLGYFCHIASDVNEALLDIKYDTVLLSTSILSHNIFKIITHHKNAIIILLVSYISQDTVSKPLLMGADDYIQKPFMIEELIRKLEHLISFKKMQTELSSYKSFMAYHFSLFHDQKFIPKINFPLALKCKNQKFMDFYMFEISKRLDRSFITIDLDNVNDDKFLDDENLFYLVNYSRIKKNTKKYLQANMHNKKIVISTNDFNDKFECKSLEFDLKNELCLEDILSLEDYLKFAICKFQKYYCDVELAKKLGISRKSLWEKRKKYEISK